ncbi:hypothetical protein RFI_40287, partial [Reticulomyxa filosa]
MLNEFTSNEHRIRAIQLESRNLLLLNLTKHSRLHRTFAKHVEKVKNLQQPLMEDYRKLHQVHMEICNSLQSATAPNTSLSAQQNDNLKKEEVQGQEKQKKEEDKSDPTAVTDKEHVHDASHAACLTQNNEQESSHNKMECEKNE